MLAKPSLEPSVATTCVSGLSFTPKRRRIVAGLGAAQAGNAARGGIAVRARIAHHLAQFVDDGLRRRQVGIAHAEVDDVGAARTGAGLQPVDLLEHVRRQPPDLVKLFHGQFLVVSAALGRASDNLVSRSRVAGSALLRLVFLDRVQRRRRACLAARLLRRRIGRGRGALGAQPRRRPGGLIGRGHGRAFV